MIAGMRYRFLLSWLMLIFFAAACWPVQAQINGVPASVTSLGFGGSANPTPGVRASVTSLGPNGYGNARPMFGDCCANFFLPANPNPPLFSGHHRRRDIDGNRHRNRDRNKDHNFFGAGVSEPVYIPYAVPYTEEADQDSSEIDSSDDGSPEPDYARGAGPLNTDSHGKRVENRHPTVKTYASRPEAPVAQQPSTVLVFKDGHRAEVLNYAVVGNTLFDFAADRTHKILLADLDLPATHKANDDRGVDFEIPAGTTGN
jgi:hypothetical protein